MIEPHIHLYNSIDGKGAGEFPIIYYLNAKIWKFTGESVFLIRFETMLFLFLGLYALFRLSAIFIKDMWFRLLIPFIVFASPLIAFYGDKFLVNISALSFVFVAWNMIARGELQNRQLKVIIGFTVLTLAALLRPTMIIALAPVFVYYASRLYKTKGLRRFLTRELWYFVGSTAIVLAWVIYIKNYNEVYDSVYFLTNLVPFWTQDFDTVWQSFKKVVLVELYPISFLIVLETLTIYTSIKLIKLNRMFMLMFTATFLLVAMYFALWFGNFNVHDYYLMEFFVFIPMLIGGFFYLIEKNERQIKWVRISSILILFLFLLPSSITRTRIKYATSDAALASMFIEKDEIELWQWSEWFDKVHYQAFEDLRPLLRNHGIRREDLVISFGDPTSNYTLSLMDQKGFTDLYAEHLNRSEKVKFYKELGAKYIIINSDDLMKEIDSNYTENLVLKYENISVFKL